MVNNTIHATYIETYDINTIQNELSILAIHTPQSNTLKRFFHGFYEQYKKMKVLGCNFKIACASKQDLDPTLVGFEEGQIDPRDVMNPLLFKACTGEGINVLLDQIYNKSEEIANTGSNLGHSIDQHILTDNSSLKAYYSLLADESYRKAHPQAGMTVMGLKPMVHKVVTTQPFKWTLTSSGNNDLPRAVQGTNPGDPGTVRGFGGQSGSANYGTDPVNPTVFVSNGVTDMPWLDTAFSKVNTFTFDDGSADGVAKSYNLQANIPRVYMGVLILPPSSGTQNLYFRISVVWHILFKDFRMAQDLLPITNVGPHPVDDDSIQMNGLDEQNAYFNMYHTASKLQKDYGSFDTQGVESVSEVLQKGQ